MAERYPGGYNRDQYPSYFIDLGSQVTPNPIMARGSYTPAPFFPGSNILADAIKELARKMDKGSTLFNKSGVYHGFGYDKDFFPKSGYSSDDYYDYLNKKLTKERVTMPSAVFREYQGESDAFGEWRYNPDKYGDFAGKIKKESEKSADIGGGRSFWSRMKDKSIPSQGVKEKFVGGFESMALQTMSDFIGNETFFGRIGEQYQNRRGKPRAELKSWIEDMIRDGRMPTQTMMYEKMNQVRSMYNKIESAQQWAFDEFGYPGLNNPLNGVLQNTYDRHEAITGRSVTELQENRRIQD